MKSVNSQMGLCAILLLLLSLRLSNASQRKTSVGCTNYLRCRNDEIEQRWECHERDQMVITEVCPLGEHLKIARTLAIKRERSFAACISSYSLPVDDTSCSETPPSSRGTCNDLNYVVPSRCDSFLKCCFVSSRCEQQSEYLKISQLLLNESKNIEMLLHDCSQKVDNIMAANATKNDREVVKVLNATVTILNMMSGLQGSSTKRTVLHKLVPRHGVTSDSSFHFTVDKASYPKILVLPKSFLPRMTYTKNKDIKIYTDPSSYRKRAQMVIEARKHRFRVNASAKNSIKSTAYFNTKAQPHHSFLRSINSNSKRSPKPAYNVDLIIDRSFLTYPLYHEHLLTPLSYPAEKFRFNAFEQHPSPTLPALHAPPAPPSPPAPPAPPAPLPLPYPKNIVRQQMQNYSPASYTGSERSASLSHRPKTLRRLVVLRPLAPQSHRVRHGPNRLTNKSLHKMTLKPRKIISTPLLRPPVSLKNHSIRFTNDTDTLTDVAVPYKNRQTSKRRINVHEGKSFSEQFGSVGATTVLPLVKQSFREDLRSFLQSTSDEIYEDVLQNQQEALFGNNNAVAPETDFDDLSIFERTQHNTDKIPIPSVFDPAHPHPVSRVDSTATRFPLPPTLVLSQRNNNHSGRKLVSESAGTTASPRLPIALHREDVSLSLPSGDPLDAPILLRPLTNDVVELGRLHREQVRQKVVDDTSESFAVDKNVERQHGRAMTELQSSSENTYSNTEIIKEKPIDAFISRTTHFADSIPIRIVDEWSTMTYASSSTPIPSELKTITMQVDEAATIIPTLENTPWTAPPSENSFRSDTIPLAQNVAIDGPLIVVNKVDGSTSSIQNNESNFSFSLSHRTSSEVVDRLWRQGWRKHSRAMASKTYRRKPISSKLTPIDEPSMPKRKPTEAFSVLKLSKTTLRLSHCEVYSLCLDELSHEDVKCHVKGGRLMPGLPKRRRGFCSRRLVPTYQAVDDEMRNLERMYSSCIKSRLGHTITEVMPTKCAANSLPSSLTMEPCHSKVQALKYHCSKLARCCPDADVCRNELNHSEAARTLRRRKESLAVAATKCQVDSDRKYRKESSALTGTTTN